MFLSVALVSLALIHAPRLPHGPSHGPSHLPPLADFAATPAPVGAEAGLLARIAALLPLGARTERDSFGSLIVRFGDPAAPVRLLVAVGVDQSGYVVSQIRADGWLRLRYLGSTPVAARFHENHEGRPVQVLTRAGPLPGVVAIDSTHLREPRPEKIGEEHLYLDVGADSPEDVRRMGIGLLDPIAWQEVVELADGRVAAPDLGRRAAALALLRHLHSDPAENRDPGVAYAFGAQTQVGAGPLGRGGEGLVRRLAPVRVIVLRPTADPAAEALKSSASGTEWTALDLPVLYLGTPVENATAAEVERLAQRIDAAVKP